jgi:phosphatidylglycerophosphate synthase
LQTVVGSVVDPMADKILMTTLVGCLAINGSLPRESSKATMLTPSSLPLINPQSPSQPSS